jgi:hypothetical protein
MAETVGSHGVASFTNPSNGDSLDATIVKGNDNTLRSAYVDHDSDGGVHVQSSSLATRPTAGTTGRKWLTNDAGEVKLWYDNGAAWEEVAYVPSSGTATIETLAVTNGATFDTNTLVVDATNNRVGVATTNPTVALDVTGVAKVSNGLTVSASGVTVTGNSTITGTLGGLTGLTVASGGAAITGNSSVTGVMTATTFSGSGASLTSIPAANLTGTAAAINGSNITNLNGSAVASGTVPNARLDSNLTGFNSVSAAGYTGAGAGAATLYLADGSTDFLSIPTGSDFQVTNNGSPNNYTSCGPTGTSTYNGGQDDRLIKVLYNGVQYYLRLERWT